ncbi:LacI family DNA-binding transcriptional regulator [Arthrobacter castelli]|uniref:LacI family DNA-binding transcriptional regulator n=1 Tax=Arthrobacter castelli TaxID=271431 RepID=UPI00041EFE4D|nr:LacI family DNA-binding transcriptional regulator [Arthrobacter castelli]
MSNSSAGQSAPTSKDVARLAGVSQSTVSYALSGKRSVSPDVKDRINRAIAELSYQPNSGARALRGRKSHVIGLIMPARGRFDRSSMMMFVLHIAATARSYGYDILIVTEDEGPDGIRRVAKTSLCDALIIMEIATADPRLEAIAAVDIPGVLIGVPPGREGFNCVDLDFAAAGELAVGRLTRAGHTRIGLLIPRMSSTQDKNFPDRLIAGARNAAAVQGTGGGANSNNDDVVTVIRPEGTYEGVRKGLAELRSHQPSLTGFICMMNPFSPYHALTAGGLDVGATTGLIAVCDHDEAENLPVRITNIDPRREEVSRLAVARAVELVETGHSGATPVQLIEPLLIERDSVPDRPGAATE